MKGLSFGSLRAALITDAIIATRKHGPRNLETFKQTVVRMMAVAGINPDEPHLQGTRARLDVRPAGHAWVVT